MEWYYALGDRRNGPVTSEQLAELLLSRTITDDTMVWRVGLENWTRYADVEKSGQGVAADVVKGEVAQCAECQRILPKDELIAFEGKHICGGCKPLFFQRMLEGVTPFTGKIWRSNKHLVTPLDVILPQRCIKCNEVTTSPQNKRKLYWHSPIVYAALVLNVLLYAILAVCVRKKALAMFSVCDKHRRVRRNVLLTTWLMVFGGLAMFLVGAFRDHLWMLPTGALAFVGGIFYGMIRGRLLYAKKMDKEHAWLAGCGSNFLDSLPDWKTGF